jgi:hypothetical protein
VTPKKFYKRTLTADKHL